MKKKKYRKLSIFIIIIVLIISIIFCVKKNQTLNSKTSSVLSKANEEVSEELKEDNKDIDEEEPVETASNLMTYSVEAKEVNGYLENKAKEDSRKIVFLTFDDGPAVGTTDAILDILKKNDVKATFFLLGKSIDASTENKKTVKRQFEEGHTIGNHTYSHEYEKLYPKEQTNVDEFMKEFDKTNSVINEAIGHEYKMKVFRMPNGYMTRKHRGDKKVDKLINTLKERDVYSIDWNSLSYDAEGNKKTPKELINNIKNTSKNKKELVILMHDTKQETLDCLQELIDTLKEEQYQFMIFR